MALSRVKTWNAAETLTASDLNAEFNNICNHFGSLTNADIDSTASYVMGELVVGTGITSADGGQLHVHTATAGTIQAVADADEAVFENSGASGITILSGATSTGNIAFGDSGDADNGLIKYTHGSTPTLGVTVAATAVQSIAAAATTLAHDLEIYQDVNNADSAIKIGTSATEALFVEALNGGSNKTLEELRFTTKTASGTADHGKMSFYVDETVRLTVADGGINVPDEVQTTGIGYTDGDNAITIADGGGCTFPQSATFTSGFSNNDQNITNVGNIALDTISSDAGTTVSVTLGTDAGDDFIVGNNSALVVEGDNDRVGIGTAAPDVQFHVEAGSDTTTGTLPSARFERTGASQTGVTLRSNNIDGLILRADSAGLGAVSSYEDLAFYTGATPGSSYGTARMRIDSATGNIGIGTTPGDSAVHIYKGSAGSVAAISGAALTIEDDAASYLQFLNPADTEAGIIFGRGTDNNHAGMFYGSDEQLYFTANNAERMRIDSSGNVGIGATPQSKLEVSSTDQKVAEIYSSNANPYLVIAAEAETQNDAPGIAFNATKQQAPGSANTIGQMRGKVTNSGGALTGQLEFYTNAGDSETLAMTIDSSQNVGIAMAPGGSHKLDVTGSAGLSTGTAWTNTSDARIKRDVTTITGATAKLKRLRPVSYKYTDQYLSVHSEIDGSKTYHSFVADEYETVFPDAVSDQGDLVKTTPATYYADGDDLPDGKSVGDEKTAETSETLLTNLKQYTPHDLQMFLTAAVQELDARIAALESA